LGVSTELTSSNRPTDLITKRSPAPDQKGSTMIVLGIVLIVLGLVLPTLVPTFAFAHLLVVFGVILLIVGVILAILGSMGRAVGGRRHYY
jgi:uncharacterized membrane protein HdeD (DUF308 family)